MTKNKKPTIDGFVDFLISENCAGCQECDPKKPLPSGVVCMEQGFAKFVLDTAEEYKRGGEE